jgi:hypothetical protein
MRQIVHAYLGREQMGQLQPREKYGELGMDMCSILTNTVIILFIYDFFFYLFFKKEKQYFYSDCSSHIIVLLYLKGRF